MSLEPHNPRKRRAETQEEAWVADEDRFVLQQAKKRAALKVRSGRGKPIDQLAVALRALDPPRNGLDDEDEDQDLAIITPEAVFEGLDDDGLADLEKEIDTYLALEKSRSNHEYWQTMKLVCIDKRRQTSGTREDQCTYAVAAQLDRVLSPKSMKELEALEAQVRQKLRSDEAIDVDYWQSLMKRIAVHKARAQLRKVTQDIQQARTKGSHQKQVQAAGTLQREVANSAGQVRDTPIATGSPDPASCQRVSSGDKDLPFVQGDGFRAGRADLAQEQRRVADKGYPQRFGPQSDGAGKSLPSGRANGASGISAYDREVAKGMDEDEEVFTGEESTTTAKKPAWSDKYVPRKPRYFNRVQLGYEWNKYNQTHYDQGNPPPKVVQGYKFNIFYPDLVDVTKAPTYRIERENGRKRGETLAPAGEEDMCIIRFTAGPPYEDVAFRIVDREWDYSSRRERGFKSSFDKGILQLHFQFKKIYYRK